MDKQNNRELSKMFLYAGKYHGLTILGCVLSGISTILSMLPFVCIWLVIRDFIHALGQGDVTLAASSSRYAWLAVLFSALSILLYFFALNCSHLAAFRTATNMRKEAVHHIVTLPLGYFDRNASGRLRKIIDDNAGLTEGFLAHQLPDLTGAVVMPVAVLALIFLFDWRLGICCLLPMAVSVFFLKQMMGGDNSQLEGSGQLAWKYSGFKELHLRARLAFPADGSGKAGIFCGDVFCCLNIDTQRVELYKGSTLLGSYSQAISRTPNADLRGNPAMYTVEMRIRGNRVRVYSGASYTLRFTAPISGFSGGYAGYRSDNRTVCELMRLGDAWTYEPYEWFDVRMPDGSFKSFGRISRSSAAWDEEFQVFTLTADVEESSTHGEDISMDYDFFHSDLMELSCGNNYTAEFIRTDAVNAAWR